MLRLNVPVLPLSDGRLSDPLDPPPQDHRKKSPMINIVHVDDFMFFIASASFLLLKRPEKAP
jgi:hypothetical protein